MKTDIYIYKTDTLCEDRYIYIYMCIYIYVYITATLYEDCYV